MALSPAAQALVAKYSSDTSGTQDVQEAATTGTSDASDLASKYAVTNNKELSETPAQAPQSKVDALVSKYKQADEGAPQSGGDDLGVMGSLAKGAIEGLATGPTFNAVNYLTSIAPNIAGYGLDKIYGEGFSSDQTTDQQRRDMIIAHDTAWKRDLLNEYHLNGNAEGHQIAYTIGSMGSSLLDPTTLIAGPAAAEAKLGGRLIHAGGMGAAFGLAQGATEGLAEKGEIDAKHTALTTALGTLGGVALQGALIEPLSLIIDRTVGRGRPATVKDVEGALKDVKTDPNTPPLPDAKTITDTLNSQMDLFGHTPEESIQKMAQEGRTASDIEASTRLAQADEYLNTGDVSSYTKNKDQLEMKLKEKKPPQTIDERMQAANDKYDELVAKGKIKPSIETEQGANQIPGEKTVIDTRGEGQQYHGSKDEIHDLVDDYYSPSNIYGQGFYTTDATDIALGYSKGRFGFPGGETKGHVYKADAGEVPLYDMEKPLDDNIKGIIEKSGLTDHMEEGFLDKAKNLREVYNEFIDSSKANGLSKDTVQEYFDSLRYNLEEQGYKGLTHEGGLKTGSESHKVNIYWNPESDVRLSKADVDRFYHQKWEKDPVSDQMLESNQLLQEMSDDLKNQARIENTKSSTGSGAAETMPPDIAAVEAIKQGDIPVESELGQSIAKMDVYEQNWEKPDPSFYSRIAETATKFWKLGRPEDKIKQAGKLGEKAVELLDDFERIRHQKLGTVMVEVQKDIFNKLKLSKAEMEQVPLLAQKLIKPGDTISPKVNEAAKEFGRVFDEQLRDFVKQGLITPKQGLALIAHAKEKGYWPRLYNRDLINSPKGREAFEVAIMNTGMKFDDALKAVKAIAGEKNKDNLANYLRKGPNGEYFLNKDVPKMLWDKLQDIHSTSKSSHIEQQRNLPEALDRVLQPFLITDPELVVAHYLQDSTERLAAAEVFGNKHEVAKTLFSEMHQAGFPEEARTFRETFLTTMRDPMSKAAQSFMDQPKIAKDASRILRAMQVWKMTMSQLTNISQLPVYGLTKSAGISGLTLRQRAANSMAGVAKGFMGSFGENALKEEAQRAGAATSAAAVEAFGKLNDPANSLTGRRLWGPAEFFNNPSTFLRRTGFNWSENVNRIGAYHMGKAHLSSLLKNKIEYEALGNRINPKKLEAVYKGLEELGIPRDIDTSKLSVQMVENAASKMVDWDSEMGRAMAKAGTNFNSAVNFTNAAHKLPLFAQSFYGKLIWQLRSFSYNGYHFAVDNVLAPARRGNFLPLITYLGVGTAIGMPMAEFKRMILADNSQMTGFEKVLEAQVSVAGLGMAQDFLRSATYGKQGVESFILGPGVAQAADMLGSVGSVYNAFAAGKGVTVEPVLKSVVRNASFPFKKAVMESMKADKQGFEAKMARREGRLNNMDQTMQKKMDRLEKKH